MFYVPKGEDDIRIVFNGTSSGLNDALWAPHFGLPTVQHTLRSLMPGAHQADLDIGEMFLNFMLHDSLRQYSGVDLTHLRSEDQSNEEWEAERKKLYDERERWVRNWMGTTDSPQRSIQMLLKAKTVAYGRKDNTANPYQWDSVQLNLPGS